MNIYIYIYTYIPIYTNYVLFADAAYSSQQSRPRKKQLHACTHAHTHTNKEQHTHTQARSYTHEHTYTLALSHTHLLFIGGIHSTLQSRPRQKKLKT